MKQFTFLLIVIVLSFTSCVTRQVPLESSTPKSNATYEIFYLFEHNGCKVYRFLDMGNYVYFTDCDSNVTAIQNDSIKTRVQTIIKRR